MTLVSISAMNNNQNKRQRGALSLRRARAAGFTLLEMLIVIMIILILAGIAAGRYEKSVLRSKETVLKQDLFVMRQAIQQYTLDKQVAPTSLDDLVSGKYISQIPKDPITRNNDWTPISDDTVVLSPEQTASGLIDVKSSSSQISPLEGTAYNTW
jgi:general secretion pathway protein G